MASVNRVILLGNIGRDPEVRYTQAGTAVANFSIATSERYKDRNGENQEKTEWHNIVAWSKLAEFSKNYLTKGQSIYLEGKLQTSKYTDRDGQERRSTEIVADRIQFAGPKPNGNGRSSSSPDDTDSDIPF